MGVNITVDQDPTDVDGLDVNGNTVFTDPGDIEPVVIDLDTDSDTGILGTIILLTMSLQALQFLS